jgi:transposase
MSPLVKHVVTLTAEERSFLANLITKGKTAAHKQIHARILLKADEGPQGEHWSDPQIADALSVSLKTVERTRRRFVEESVDAALNRKQQQNRRRPKIDGDAEAHLIALSCGKPPEGRARWTLHLLADKLVELKYVDEISLETVRRTLKKTP